MHSTSPLPFPYVLGTRKKGDHPLAPDQGTQFYFFKRRLATDTAHRKMRQLTSVRVAVQSPMGACELPLQASN